MTLFTHESRLRADSLHTPFLEDATMTERNDDADDAEVRQSIADLSDQQLQTALETAASCFAIWRSTTNAERAAVVAKAAAVMRSRSDFPGR
jgi:delta 1-pyrroline-5-carboxylate dehydrogenase